VNAVIYDFCVLPEDPSDPVGSLSLIDVELRRIVEFGEDALNHSEIVDLIQNTRVSGRAKT
jgi:hypothetical protein